MFLIKNIYIFLIKNKGTAIPEQINKSQYKPTVLCTKAESGNDSMWAHGLARQQANHMPNM